MKCCGAVRSRVGVEAHRVEEAVNAILKNAGCLGKHDGIYTRRQLRRKCRNDQAHEVDGRQDDNHELVEQVVARRVDELVEAAGLTALQEICFRLRVDGLSVHQIAHMLGVNHRVICARLAGARRKLRIAYWQGPYAGWHEVYLSEVRRYVYRPPRHIVQERR